MVAPLFAMPPPQVLFLMPVGLLVVLLVTGLFVSATRTLGKGSEGNRRAALGLTAIVCGPLVGASLAWLGNTLGEVHQADVGYRYVVFTSIGGIAGLLAGVAFGITGLLCPENPGGKGVPAGLGEAGDES